jgi:hypothetical protein
LDIDTLCELRRRLQVSRDEQCDDIRTTVV